MEKGRVIWIDVMRGLAIIAVVVCHQQWILHESEVVQCITLYSVTSLIFLMGMTKGFSLEKFTKKGGGSFFKYTVKSLMPVLSAYALATFVIIKYRHGDASAVFQALLDCSASPPLYYVQHIVRFSILAPFIYGVIKWIFEIKYRFLKVSVSILFLLLTWLIGYFSIGRFDVFGQSYLFVYSLGMLISLVGMPKLSWKSIVFEVLAAVLGVYAVIRFYFARVAGDYAYSGFVDVIDPALQMNPPNVSVILYSAAVVFGVYLICTFIVKYEKAVVILKPFSVLGRYSLDVFLWHVFIRELWSDLFGLPENIWIRRVLIYSLMFAVPISARKLYTKFIKEKLHSLS